MNKKLCITTFVFGEGYQGYIPMFIYSILKSYNDYFPLIFLHDKLTIKVSEQLELLRELGDFEVVENYLAGEKLSNQQGKSIRWVLDDHRFERFDAVYIGDIDIFIVPEEPGLYEQHSQHCQTLGLPYSNAVRPRKDLTFIQKLRGTIDVFIEMGLLNSVRFLFQHERPARQFTGLHFVKTREYFERIRPLIPKYTQLITDNSFRGRKKTVQHQRGFNNESLLYDMLTEAGIGLRSNAEFSLDYKDYNKIAFRPHHGLHMGIFKTDNIVRNNLAILDTQIYKEYYQKFRRMTENDPVFNSLREGFSKAITGQFERMHKYYGQSI
jgi:hypothetical protein